MFRFSRDKRFFARVSHEEFVQASTALMQMTKAVRPGAEAEILTAEDATTHRYSRVTFITEAVTEALKRRASYVLDELSEDVWQRSLTIQLTIRDETDDSPFMICLSLDKKDEPRSMKFYGQSVESNLIDSICNAFARPSLLWSIGDGYSKQTSYNHSFGERVTRLILR